MDSYDAYRMFDFSIPVGKYGDCYDRYMVRMHEMRQSIYIIEQALFLVR
jgi:NADH-quinone oxidoreductase subunit D